MFEFRPNWLYLDLHWVSSSADSPVQASIAGVSYVTADLTLKYLGRLIVYDPDGGEPIIKTFEAECLEKFDEDNIELAPEAARQVLDAARMSMDIFGECNLTGEVDTVELRCLGEDVPQMLIEQPREWYDKIGEVSERKVNFRL